MKEPKESPGNHPFRHVTGAIGAISTGGTADMSQITKRDFSLVGRTGGFRAHPCVEPNPNFERRGASRGPVARVETWRTRPVGWDVDIVVIFHMTKFPKM